MRTLRAMVKHDAFDAFIDAHEDPEEDGFYVYAFLEDRAWHPEIVQAVARRGPVTGKSEVDETPVAAGLISVGEGRTREEAFQEYMEDGEWPLPFYPLLAGHPIGHDHRDAGTDRVSHARGHAARRARAAAGAAHRRPQRGGLGRRVRRSRRIRG